jgi:Uma2 family endonuclease
MASAAHLPVSGQFDPAVEIDANALASQSPLVLPDCTWEQYLAVDAALGDRRGVKVRFLHGYLEIMSPTSLEHKRRKSHLGCLVEAWCLEREIDFFINGETTLRREFEAAGAPDESYMFHLEKDRPDLVIEVALTSGGLSKRTFYKRFGIPELWIWRNDRLEVHRLSPETNDYEVATQSEELAGIPLSDVEECARIESASQAIREFRRRIAR